jgi:adenosylcobinamide-phosphate synthase
MSFFAVLVALLIEQLRPLPGASRLPALVQRWFAWTARNLDAGQVRHAWIVWGVAVLGPAAVACALYLALRSTSLMLALALDVAVLYLTLGFRPFSHWFTAIRDALDRGDEPEARRLLADWRGLDASELPRTALLRHVIEHSLLAAHRHVFGVFFGFVALSAVGLGPAGALVYRLAEAAARHWGPRARPGDVEESEALRSLSRRLFELIDHVPARLTAFGFAVVGNFEEAINSWRRDAALWLHPNEGIILAAAAGAVGVQLGGSAPTGVTPERAPSAAVQAVSGGGETDTGGLPGGGTAGMAPQLAHLQSCVGLVWRSVVLWMLTVALLSLANVLG